VTTKLYVLAGGAPRLSKLKNREQILGKQKIHGALAICTDVQTENWVARIVAT
jgi:hypothetical protein